MWGPWGGCCQEQRLWGFTEGASGQGGAAAGALGALLSGQSHLRDGFTAPNSSSGSRQARLRRAGGPHPPPSNTAAPRSDPSCPSLAWLVSPTAVSYCTGVAAASAALELRRVGVLVPTCNAPRYKSVPLAGDAGPKTFWDVLGGRRLCLPQSWRNPTCRRVSNASQQDVLGRKHVEQKWARFPIIYTHL